MTLLLGICRFLSDFGNRISVGVGQTVAWLTALLALTTAAVVAMRLMQQGSIGLQESLTYMHALIIMAAGAYTLAEDGHVRVDIFYRRFDVVKQAWVNALGTVFFLLPFAVFTVLISWQYVASAWSIRETSADAGGIPAVFLLKSLILCNGSLLIVQALAELAKHISTLTRLERHT